MKGLWPYIHLDTKVANVRWIEDEDQFEVEVEGRFLKKGPGDYKGHADLPVDEKFVEKVPVGKPLLGPEGSKATYKVDRVIIASGGNQIPVKPTWPGQEKFKGEIIHSMDYKGAEPYVGKNVVCVGAGESGSDITFMISEKATKTYMVIRNHPGFVIPRMAMGAPTDLDTCRMRHSISPSMNKGFLHWRACVSMPRGVILGILPGYWTKVSELNCAMLRDMDKRDAQPFGFFGTKSEGIARATYENGTEIKPGIAEIKERSVVFTDGTEVECDAIVCNTGYKTQLPYMEKYCSELLDPVRTACGGGIDVRRLYKNVFHPYMNGRLCWVGFARPALGAVPPLAEMQARLVAMVASGEHTLPEAEQLVKLAEADRSFYHWMFGYHAERIKALVLHLTYTDSMADLIGCKPKLWKLFLESPRAWVGAMFGCIGCSQYRLDGPHAKREYVLKTLRECAINNLLSMVVTVIMAIVGWTVSTFGGFSESMREKRPLGQLGGISAKEGFRPTFLDHAKIPDLAAEREEHRQKTAAQKAPCT